MEISSAFWILDLTDWSRQSEDTQSNNADLPNVACDTFSNIPHCVGVVASFSVVQDVIAWSDSKSTGKTHREKVVVLQFAGASNTILGGDNQSSDTMNTDNASEMKREVEDKKLHRMAKVHDCLEMWQCSQILCATQKESRAQ